MDLSRYNLIMIPQIRVAILDDHQAIIDGYQYRLRNATDIEVTATLFFGEDLEPALAANPVDILLLDIQVPISPVTPILIRFFLNYRACFRCIRTWIY